jgi:hypothetical protein
MKMLIYNMLPFNIFLQLFKKLWLGVISVMAEATIFKIVSDIKNIL